MTTTSFERWSKRRASTPMRWTDICLSARITGQLKNFSKTECLRLAKQLDKRVERGEIKRLSRGLYQLVQ
jgi:hypothetical protein